MAHCKCAWDENCELCHPELQPPKPSDREIWIRAYCAAIRHVADIPFATEAANKAVKNAPK